LIVTKNKSYNHSYLIIVLLMYDKYFYTRTVTGSNTNSMYIVYDFISSQETRTFVERATPLYTDSQMMCFLVQEGETSEL